MKRVGHLIEKIAEIDNLYLAYSKACRGKRLKEEVKQFSLNLDHNVALLQQEIISGNVKVGSYHYFTIHDPKERMICAASFRERVLHHAIMNVCHDYFDRSLIADTYATRKGKGVYAALDKVCSSISPNQWLCKLDVRKYYDSIDHGILKKMLERKFKDPRLLHIFFLIIDSYESVEGKGLPIGNLTSQYFANMYLSGLDHYAKEILKVKLYVRYMDDILMAFNEKATMKETEHCLRTYAETHLLLELKPPVCAKGKTGSVFLGYRVSPNCLKLSGRSKRRFSSKYTMYKKKLELGVFSEREYQIHLLPLLAFVLHANSKCFRRACFKYIPKSCAPKVGRTA